MKLQPGARRRLAALLQKWNEGVIHLSLNDDHPTPRRSWYRSAGVEADGLIRLAVSRRSTR